MYSSKTAFEKANSPREEHKLKVQVFVFGLFGIISSFLASSAKTAPAGVTPSPHSASYHFIYIVY